MPGVVVKLSPNYNRRYDTVRGLVLHWTDGSYESSVEWTCSAKSRVSYHAIIGPTGEVTQTVPWNGRAWAMGYCAPSTPKLPYKDANSVFESISLAGGPPVPPTEEQVASAVDLCVRRFRAHTWGPDEVWRITTHQAEAVWGPGTGAKEGKRGRKIDPEGTDAAHKWLDVEALRLQVAHRLG